MLIRKGAIATALVALTASSVAVAAPADKVAPTRTAAERVMSVKRADAPMKKSSKQMSSTGIIVGVAAVAAIGLGIAAAVSSDDDDAPDSP